MKGKKPAMGLLVDSSISSGLLETLSKLRPILDEMGDIKIGKVVVRQQEAVEFSKIIAQEGFIPVIIHDDLDIHLVLETMELIYNEKIETLAIATENVNLLLLLSRARELGKEVILLYTSDKVNRGLQNAADIVLPITH